MTEKLLDMAEDNVPKRTVQMRKSTHPWLTERGEEAVRRKHEAQGTDRETDIARECSAILMEDQYAFVHKMRGDLADARVSSKSWWSKARRLLDQKLQVSSIPALKHESRWILEAEGKANCFADIVEKKNVMIDEESNEYSAIVDVHEPIARSGLPSVDDTEKVLTKLDEDSALGPDLLPTRIFETLRACLGSSIACAYLVNIVSW